MTLAEHVNTTGIGVSGRSLSFRQTCHFTPAYVRQITFCARRTLPSA
jgi:hypothetical protein